MPGQTTTWDLRYPLYGDVADPAGQIQDLAEDVNGDLVTLQTALSAVQVKLRGQISRTGSVSVPNATPTNLTFDTEDFDNDNMANLGVNNQILTVNTAGVYLVIGRVEWASNGTGERQVTLVKSTGTATIGSFREPGATGSTTRQESIMLAYMPVGTQVRLQVLQTSGGALNAADFILTAVRLAA